MSVSDSAPGFPALVETIAREYGSAKNASQLTAVKMDEWNGMFESHAEAHSLIYFLTFAADWDVLYPFSQVNTNSESLSLSHVIGLMFLFFSSLLRTKCPSRLRQMDMFLSGDPSS